VGEVFVGGEGGAGFADAALGLRAEDESLHGFLSVKICFCGWWVAAGRLAQRMRWDCWRTRHRPATTVRTILPAACGSPVAPGVS